MKIRSTIVAKSDDGKTRVTWSCGNDRLWISVKAPDFVDPAAIPGSSRLLTFKTDGQPKLGVWGLEIGKIGQIATAGPQARKVAEYMLSAANPITLTGPEGGSITVGLAGLNKNLQNLLQSCGPRED
ncbi:MAG: hypothetical protein Alpg2KO_08570 [Alphaproteobacteria bacterium]